MTTFREYLAECEKDPEYVYWQKRLAPRMWLESTLLRLKIRYTKPALFIFLLGFTAGVLYWLAPRVRELARYLFAD